MLIKDKLTHLNELNMLIYESLCGKKSKEVRFYKSYEQIKNIVLILQRNTTWTSPCTNMTRGDFCCSNLHPVITISSWYWCSQRLGEAPMAAVLSDEPGRTGSTSPQCGSFKTRVCLHVGTSPPVLKLIRVWWQIPADVMVTIWLLSAQQSKTKHHVQVCFFLFFLKEKDKEELY